MARRVVIKGTSGAGKTTFGAALAARLGVPFIELDALHHGPNWTAATADELRARVCAALAASPEGWVADGNYDTKLGDTLVSRADTIVWLDLPLGVKFARVWRRTMHRIHHRVELWNGNRETWRDFFHRDNLLVWMVNAHLRHRRRWPSRFAGDPRLVRLRTVAEAERWLAAQGRTPETEAARPGAGGCGAAPGRPYSPA